MITETGGRFVTNKFIASLVFVREWMRSPRAMGMVCPSGAALSRALAAQAPVDGEGLVVELGAGTGTVTQQLLRRGISPSRLLVVERSESMVGLLRLRFPGIRVLQGDAARLSQYLPRQARVDCIVSSLPLVSLPDPIRRDIIHEIHQVLGQGRLVQYTYSWGKGYILLHEGFECLDARRVWLNVPPARVLSFSQKNTKAFC